jgi:hypothetical protein
MVGRKVWFGPRRYGWGLNPITFEGWATIVVAVAAIIILATTVRHTPWLPILAVIALLAVIFLKGTSPGGRAEWEEFHNARDREDRDRNF